MGYIQVRFDFGSGVGFLKIKKVKVNNGKWHYVHIERYGNYVSLLLDHKWKVDGQSPGNSAKINLNGHVVVFGGGVSVVDGM